MTGVLLISTNLQLTGEALELNTSPDIRLKLVENLEQARKWLGIQDFQVIAFDESFRPEDLSPFLFEVWSLNEAILAAYVSTNDIDSVQRAFLALGIESCCGNDWLKKFNKVIDKVPKANALLSTQHSSVLVLEDLDSPRDIICAFIQSMGFERVRGVASVDAAFDELKKNPFEYFAIVADINLPERSGLSFIRELRENLTLAYLPVIVLTSDPSEENLMRALKYGISGFLAKPPKRELLKAELEKAKRMVLTGRDPEIGTPEELKILEQTLRNRKEQTPQ